MCVCRISIRILFIILIIPNITTIVVLFRRRVLRCGVLIMMCFCFVFFVVSGVFCFIWCFLSGLCVRVFVFVLFVLFFVVS